MLTRRDWNRARFAQRKHRHGTEDVSGDDDWRQVGGISIGRPRPKSKSKVELRDEAAEAISKAAFIKKMITCKNPKCCHSAVVELRPEQIGRSRFTCRSCGEVTAP